MIPSLSVTLEKVGATTVKKRKAKLTFINFENTSESDDSSVLFHNPIDIPAKTNANPTDIHTLIKSSSGYAWTI